MMKKVLPFLCLAAVLIAGSSFVCHKAGLTGEKKEEVRWYTWEEAMEASKVEKRKIFIDLYTDWCGWCKRMDKATFAKPDVAKYLNTNFYPVKFNAEQREAIEYSGHTFEYQASGRRGVHMLAYSLLDGQLGYPAMVYLDEDYARILISPGYKGPKDLMKELSFVSGGHYSTMSWEEYQNK